jgi:hypothetical protein
MQSQRVVQIRVDARCSSPEKARAGDWKMGTYSEFVETIDALVGVFHLHIFVGGDVSRRGPVRIDIAGSRGSHVARLGRSWRAVAK